MIRTSDKVFVVGSTSNGKTFFVQNFLLPLYQDAGARVVVYDGATFQYGHLGKVVTSRRDLEAALRGPDMVVVFQPRDTHEDDFDDVCRILLGLLRNGVFIVEELSTYTSAYDTPEHFRMLCARGRNDGVGVVGISQRPRHVSTWFSTQSRIRIVFRIWDELDLKGLEDRVGRKHAWRALELKPFWFLVLTDSGEAWLHAPVGSHGRVETGDREQVQTGESPDLRREELSREGVGRDDAGRIL